MELSKKIYTASTETTAAFTVYSLVKIRNNKPKITKIVQDNKHGIILNISDSKAPNACYNMISSNVYPGVLLSKLKRDSEALLH